MAVLAPAKARLLERFRSIPSDRALKRQYDRIHASGRERILQQNVSVDRLRGRAVNSLNLLIALEHQLPQEVQLAIGHVQSRLAKAVPELLLSKPSESHSNIFSLSPSYMKDLVDPNTGRFYECGTTYKGENFCDGEAYPRYLEVMQQCLTDMSPFELRLSGLFVSPSAICLQGFDGGRLNRFRAALLLACEEAGLRTPDGNPNIAHITIARYQQPLQAPEQFLALAESFREFEFGSFTIDRCYLVREEVTYLSKMTIEEELPLGSLVRV